MNTRTSVSVNEPIYWPNGYTTTDNRIEDCLMKHISPAAYCVYRQYLRYWGGDKNTAYPSLSRISSVTGLSEKTIRKVNKELVDKGFMRYESGNSYESNKYYYIPIEKILKKYNVPEVLPQGDPQDSSTVPEVLPPIKEQDNKTKDKITKALNRLPEEHKKLIQDFIYVYRTKYKEKLGFDYELELYEVNEIIKNVELLIENYDKYISIIDVFFASKEEHILNSDYSIVFFFNGKVLKTLVSEYIKTKKGSWELQAEKMYNEQIKPKLEIGLSQEIMKINPEVYISSIIRFGGGSSERDAFVLRYLVSKLEREMKSRG